MLETAVRYSHTLLREVITHGDTVVDATMGNGNDTCFLAELVGKNGCVHAFDVQKLAIENTEKRLGERNLTALLHWEGHENVRKYLNMDLKAAIFNLGYLPKSDKAVITLPETTLQALDSLLDNLLPNGRIVLVVYYGHDGGENEKEQVVEFTRSLPQEKFRVLQYQFINQRNNPPFVLCIEKNEP